MISGAEPIWLRTASLTSKHITEIRRGDVRTNLNIGRTTAFSRTDGEQGQALLYRSTMAQELVLTESLQSEV